jgi:hypothetical protein
MTSAAVALVPEDAKAPSRSPSQLGRVVEFLLVGGATLFLLPLAVLVRRIFGLDSSELAVGFLAFYAAHVINDPHFAVTYFLFYRDMKNRAFGRTFSPGQRLRYLLAGIVVPVALVAWVGSALVTGSGQSLGWMIQLMFFLVGWHYVKQGFGVLSVLSARRGFRFGPWERRAVLAHCFAGWAYGWSSPAAPAGVFEEKGVVYTGLPHPPAVELVTGVIFALSTLGLAFVLVRRFVSERRLPPPAALVGFLCSIWLWVVYSGIDPLMIYVIPGLHSVQYLYFVWLLKRNEAREAEGPPAFGRPTALRLGMLAASAIGLGWVLFRGAPEFLDDVVGLRRGSLGETPYLAALFVFVNIHHYFMDHVIWRRENPDTRFLSR